MKQSFSHQNTFVFRKTFFW